MVPYLNVTAQWDGAPDQDLLRPMGGRGFPYAGFLDQEGTMIWEARPASAVSFKEAKAKAEKLLAFMSKAKANPADEVAAAHVLLLEAQGRQQREAPKMEDLEKAAATPGLDKEILEGFKSWKLGAEIQQAMRSSRRDEGEAVYKIWKRGDRLKKGDDMLLAFLYYATKGAVKVEAEADAKKLLEEFVAAIKADAEIPEEQKTKLIKDMTELVDGLSAADEEGEEGK